MYAADIIFVYNYSITDFETVDKGIVRDTDISMFRRKNLGGRRMRKQKLPEIVYQGLMEKVLAKVMKNPYENLFKQRPPFFD